MQSCRAFPEQGSARVHIGSLESVDNFGTSEYFSEKLRFRSSKLVGCRKLSWYENESCDEHAVYFRR